MSLHYNDDNSYLFVKGKEIFNFKADNKNVNFSTQFCLGSISNGFSAHESREVSLNRNMYDYNYNMISICIISIIILLINLDILNIHKYLVTKNNIMFSLIK